jgi:hypothetical protein
MTSSDTCSFINEKGNKKMGKLLKETYQFDELRMQMEGIAEPKSKFAGL